MHLSRQQIGYCGRTAAIRHVHNVDARSHLEELRRNMLLATSTGRCKIELARVGLKVRDKFGNGFCRDGRTYLHNKRCAVKACDRCDVADEVEIEIVVERCIDRVWWNTSDKRMAVRGCSYDRLCANIAGCTRPVFDDERLAKPLRQPLAYETNANIDAASREADDHTNRPCRIGLRPRNARHGRQGGSARSQMQEFAAGKFHRALAWIMSFADRKLWNVR